MVEHYNKRIQNIIQKELFKAKDSIKIAVAWFTNELLFEPLLLKLQTGVTVELILNKDEINNSEENDINFSEFVDNGGVLHWNDSNRLMHEKYCIIDNKIVIYGSYNWTNKAEFNDESIAISRDEQNTTDFYLKSFGMLCSRYPAEAKQEQTVKKSDKSQSTENATYSAENGRRILWVSKYNLWEWECRDNPGDHIYRIMLDNGVFMDYFFTSYIAVSRYKRIEKIAVKYEKDWFLLDDKGFNRLAIKEDNIELGLYDSRSIAIRNPKNGKWGVSDFEGKLMVSCDYDEVRPWSDKDGVSYWIIKKDNLYGLSEGYNIKYNCVFDKLSSPKQPVIVGGDYGWFDEKGEYIVDAIYSDIIEEHFYASWFEHFNPSFVTKCNDGSYGICTPKFGIEEIGVVNGQELFDKIGIPEFNLCQKQESKVLEKLRESLILDILHEVYDFNHYPWAIECEKTFLHYHNKGHNSWDCYIKNENGIGFDVRRKYFEEGSKYGNAPFFYLADRNHICLDVHCFVRRQSREDWRFTYTEGYNLRICEMSRELQNNDVIIISKNTKMLCRINERFYFCILQVVNISTKSVRYIEFNFNLLYSRFSYYSSDTDHKSLNGKGNVTLQMEEKIDEYKYDYLNLLTNGGTKDTYIKLSNRKETTWDDPYKTHTGDWLRKVYQFSYDYATEDDIRKVQEIINYH